MLDFMRRNASSWVVSAILVFICFSLAFFLGGGGQIGAGPSAIATVGDEEISLTEFQFARSRNEAFYREQYGSRLTPELLRALDVPSLTLNQLVDGAVLRQEAERLGLTVPDEALRSEIREIPAFHGPGGFSPATYRAVLERQALTPARFESNLRNELLIEQLVGVIRRGVHVTEEEAFEEYRKQNDKIALEYLEIDAGALEDGVAIDETELAKFFDEQRESYRKPESVSIRYLAYRPEKFADPDAVSDEAIEEYYYLNVDTEFTNEEQVGARHILKSFDADDEESKKEARSAIEDLAAKLEAGADFEELAREHSDDPGSAVKGGDLGKFDRGKMVKPFEDAAFALEVGELSDIVESRFGFHLIKTYEHVPAGKRELEDVRDQIAEKLARDGAIDAAFDAAADDALALRESATFEQIAQSRGLEPQTASEIRAGEPVADIGRAPELVDAALALGEPGDTTDPLRVDDVYYVVELANRADSYIPELDDVRGAVETDFRKAKAAELARTKADALLAELQGGASIASLAEREGIEAKETEPFARPGNFVPGLGSLPGLKTLAFETTADGEILPRSFVLRDKAYVFVRKGHEDSTREGFEEVKEDRMDSLRLRREQEAISAFVAELKTRTDVAFNRAMIEQYVQ